MKNVILLLISLFPIPALKTFKQCNNVFHEINDHPNRHIKGSIHHNDHPNHHPRGINSSWLLHQTAAPRETSCDQQGNWQLATRCCFAWQCWLICAILLELSRGIVSCILLIVIYIEHTMIHNTCLWVPFYVGKIMWLIDTKYSPLL